MNTLRFLTPTLHGALDYAAAAALIVLPFLLGFDGLALWLSVIGGVGLIGYSLLTDYTFSAVSLISFKAHLVLDLAAAAVFVATGPSRRSRAVTAASMGRAHAPPPSRSDRLLTKTLLRRTS